MTIIDRMSPNNAPPNIKSMGGVSIVRDRILQALLLGIISIGLVTIIAVVINEINLKKYSLAAIYVGAYLWILMITFWREIPYNIRAGTVILLCYILAIAELFDTSLLGSIRFWLLTFTTIASLLFGLIPALFCTVLSVLTVIAMGLGVDNHLINLPTIANFSIGSGWLVGSLTLALISGAIAGAVSGLLRGLQGLLAEREGLTQHLQEERTSLEIRVQDRTTVIQRRLIQVRTAAEISSAISRLSDPATLYQQVVDLVQEQLHLYYVGLFLVDDLNRYAELRAGTGETGQIMLTRGHRLAIGGASMIGICISSRSPRIALDVGREAVRFNNPLLPLTRSELALPIISRGLVVGALSVQSELPEAFDDNDILVLQGIADGLATAIENIRLVSELQQNLDELKSLNRNYLQEAWANVTQDQGAVSVTYETNTAQNDSNHSVQIPIKLREQMIAWLSLDTEETNLSPEDMSFLDAITTQTALALENARLVQETQRKVVQEQKLNDISTRFSRSYDIENILKTAVEELGRLPKVSEVSVELVPTDRVPQPAVGPKSNGNGSGKEKAG
jgi:GAF domain-containing protein